MKTIGKHINNALQEELAGLPTVAKFAIVQKEGGGELLLVMLSIILFLLDIE